MFINKFNSNYNNNQNNINNLNIINNQNNLNNINIINNSNNKFHNIKNENNMNNFYFSPNNSNNNLNMSYNFSPNKHNIINDSIEDIYSASKKGDSFNSCPSLKGNHLSFNTTTDTNNNNNNVNYINNNLNNNNHNSFLKNIDNQNNQNLLSMKKLFLNLNPYTASLMRNNEENMNHILYNKNFHIYNYNSNNNYLNNFKLMSNYNINNLVNQQPKKSHSTKGFHNNINININNNQNIEGNISNDNLSYSSFGSNKAQVKKKRTSLFQNGCNKEKDLRDFKRFCDGLKIPMPEYICTQIGSRIMQKYLKKFPSDIRTILINKISKYFDKLMCDTYGNYFCQKLYNISELEQRIIILKSLKDIFLKISKNGCGAHVIQFIIGEAKSIEEKKLIIEYISTHELELSFDPEGTHVLQKIICCFPENERQNINDILCNPDNLKSLCEDSKGMGLMKKLISNTENLNNKNKIIEGIYNNCIEIAQNPFGNYIIQYIFEEWDINIYFILLKNCIDNSIILSTQKYSSNIIVKIINLYSSNINKINFKYVQKLKKIFFDNKNFFELYKNKYSRLLLSKLSKILTKEEKENLTKIFEINNDDTKNLEKINILTELFS